MGKKRPLSEEALQELNGEGHRLRNSSYEIFRELQHYFKQGHDLRIKSWIILHLIEEFQDQLRDALREEMELQEEEY